STANGVTRRFLISDFQIGTQSYRLGFSIASSVFEIVRISITFGTTGGNAEPFRRRRSGRNFSQTGQAPADPTETTEGGLVKGVSPRAMIPPVITTLPTPGAFPIASQGVGAPLTITALMPTSTMAPGGKPPTDSVGPGLGAPSERTAALFTLPPVPGEPGPRRLWAGSSIANAAGSVTES